MGVQRYARRDESIKGAEFALKQGKKKSWLKYFRHRIQTAISAGNVAGIESDICRLWK